MRPHAFLLLASLAVAGCTIPPTGPVEVTRFVAAATVARLGSGTIHIETAPGENADPAELLPYKAAVARELVALGYRETARADAAQIARVRVERGIVASGAARGPVTVGVGGGSGSYGGGAGVGIGINLGGGQREIVSTRLEVRIDDALTGTSLWEGRALFDVASSALLADRAQNANVAAEALFRDFPGNDGQTVEVPVTTQPQETSE
ncbi:DUF4136 domain-containing protein [Parerythrobacter aurantius]|uniref:DUF4136 domain-containing protein n=1 Tax=Parerythrobacter aurantius TaxID=3127706 RepID=UPI0032491EB9